MIPRTSASLLFVATALLVASCGESPTSSREEFTSTYLFYSSLDSGTSRFGLTAVDPDAPASPIAVANAATLNKAVPLSYMAGTVSGASINDLHYHYLVYGNGGVAASGNLFRLSARKSDGLFSALISSESGAFDICPDQGVLGAVLGATGTTAAYPDYANPLNSVYIYLKDAGGTNNCLAPSVAPPTGSITAVPFVVRLNHPAGTAPFTTAAANAQFPVAPVYNADGSLKRILFWTSNGSGLFTSRSIDAPLTGTLVLGGVTTMPTVLGIGSAGQILLSVNNTLRMFDPVALTLSASLGVSTGVSPFTASDASAFYYRIGNTIYRAPYSTTVTSQITTVVTEATGTIEAGWDGGFFVGLVRVNDMVISGGRLVYSLHDVAGNNVNIRSVPATGGSPSTIYSYTETSSVVGDTQLYRMRAAAGRVYLSMAVDTNPNAVSVADTGGASVVYPNSRWVGFTYHPSTRLFGDFDKSGTNMRPKSMFRIAYDAVNGDRLSSVDADTTAPLADFGAIAPTFSSYLFAKLPDILGIASSERTLLAFNNAGGGMDIVYLHARDGSSARQVTFNDTDTKQLVGMNNNGGCTIGNGDEFDPVLLVLVVLSLIYIWRRRSRDSLPRPGAMRRGLARAAAAIGLMTIVHSGAGAQEISIVPAVGIGRSSMDFRSSVGERDKATFNVLEMSLTAAYKGVYLRASTELPLGESYAHGPALVRQFKRDEASLTLGWFPLNTFAVSDKLSALRGLSIFTGYLSSRTSIVSFDGGAGLPPYAVYTEHLDEGVYYGLGYSYRLRDFGSLSVNVARANMDGSLRVEPSAPGFVSTHETGTTKGLSYGLSWTGSIRDKATYYLSWRKRSYTTELVTISIDKDFQVMSAGFIFPL